MEDVNESNPNKGNETLRDGLFFSPPYVNNIVGEDSVPDLPEESSHSGEPTSISCVTTATTTPEITKHEPDQTANSSSQVISHQAPNSLTTSQNCPSSSSSLASNTINCDDDFDEECSGEVSLKVRWSFSKAPLTFAISKADFDTFTLLDLKELILQSTDVPVERQKLLGIFITESPKSIPKDSCLLTQLGFKQANSLMLIGTPPSKLFVDPKERDDLPEVENDISYPSEGVDVNGVRTPLHLSRLLRVKQTTDIPIISLVRPELPLLVLDLDYTLFDCKGFGESIEDLKRPFLEEFMCCVAKKYNIAIWSQTSWRWLEVKCTELGFLTSTNYSISFVLDRSAMFTVSTPPSSTGASNIATRRHLVKALEVIWDKFDHWGPSNTIHVDDLARNFAFNPKNGIKVSGYKRSKKSTDSELLMLIGYLDWLSSVADFSSVNHSKWKHRAQKGMSLGKP